MKEKVTEAEMIRRLKEATADEDKYFPGVLGSPVTFAARWGLTLSKGYRRVKANKLAAQKRRPEKSGDGRDINCWAGSSLDQATTKFGAHISSAIEINVENPPYVGIKIDAGTVSTKATQGTVEAVTRKKFNKERKVAVK
jgi:hypothetical protein